MAFLRIPLKYLANMLTAGAEAPVKLALERMLAMRGKTVYGETRQPVLDAVGLSAAQAESIYRYLASANYEDRFVIPTTHREYATSTFDALGERGGCGFGFGNDCASGVSKSSLFGNRKSTDRRGQPVRIDRKDWRGPKQMRILQGLSALLSYPSAELKQAVPELRVAVASATGLGESVSRASGGLARRTRVRRPVRSASALRGAI